MPKKFQSTKNSIRKRETINKQKMDSPTIRIASELENIERNRRMEFSIKGEGLITDYLSISSRIVEIGFVKGGEVKSIDIPQAICESTINGIILGLKSGKIQNNKEYNYREFKAIYLKNLVDELGKDSSQKPKERIDENSQLRGSTTEVADYQMKEDVTIESASLTKQEFDFASSEATTKEINDVINEIKESNASYGITPEDISHFGHNSKEVLEHPIFNSTDVEGPKLPKIPSGEQGTAAVIAGGILGGVLAVAFAGLGYFVWHRKNREGSYDVEKAMKNLPEQTQPEHSRATSETESLLSNATLIPHLPPQRGANARGN